MPRDFLHPDKALKIVTENKSEVKKNERIFIKDALGRVISENIYSPINDPPFNKSAMDGYAYIKKDNKNVYLLASQNTISAGDFCKVELKENECIKIMTGAKLPDKATHVQRIEFTREIKTGKNIFIEFKGEEISSNVIKKSSNQKKHDLILKKCFLSSKEIGVLASLGYEKVLVKKRMKAGIISTGNEIIKAGKKLKGCQIYDANGQLLSSLCKSLGLEVTFYGVVTDNINLIKNAIKKMLLENDIVIVSGGVSMGDYDYIPEVLSSLNIKQIFHGIAMKPGKPMFFGKKNNKAVFGLPGNPVSSFITFEYFVKPYIMSSLGIDYEPVFIYAKAGEEIKRKESDRLEFLPGVLFHKKDKTYVKPVLYNNSSMISSFACANVIIRMDIGVSVIHSGERVYARLI